LRQDGFEIDGEACVALRVRDDCRCSGPTAGVDTQITSTVSRSSRNGWMSLIFGDAGIVWDGGRDRDRTCDPLDVNEVLSR
jgi:hypothetical protein